MPGKQVQRAGTTQCSRHNLPALSLYIILSSSRCLSSVTLSISRALSSSLFLSFSLSFTAIHSLSHTLSHSVILSHTLPLSAVLSYVLFFSPYPVTHPLHQSRSSFRILSSLRHTLTEYDSVASFSLVFPSLFFCPSIFHFVCRILYLPFISVSLSLLDSFCIILSACVQETTVPSAPAFPFYKARLTIAIH